MAETDWSAPALAETNLDAIAHNALVLAALAGHRELVGIVKANGYGHGAAQVARTLIAQGVRRLSVATVGEGVELRNAGIDVPIHIFSAVLPADLPAFPEHNLELTVASEHAADAAIAFASAGGSLTVHVKVDSGMHRLGLAPEEAATQVRRLQAAPTLNVVGLWTHLATADAVDVSFVAEQFARFQSVLDELGTDCPPLVHAYNGPAFVRQPAMPELRVPAQCTELARLGGVMYGMSSDDSLGLSALGLRPAMRLLSRVVHLQTVQPGESVSYGRRWVAEKPTRVATVSIGYADGVPRALSNRGEVGIGGALFPIAGTVCMDMLMVDVGGPNSPVQIGDEVVIFGPGGPRLEDAGAAATTMCYTLTCGLTARVARRFIGS